MTVAAATSRAGGAPLGTLEGLVAAVAARDGARFNKASTSSLGQDQTLQGQEQHRLGELNDVRMGMGYRRVHAASCRKGHDRS